ncbi:2-hydroxychromene-2-carboxylate isomerase [Sinimarinibacterium sp. CAU 1509]|uniref:2-hydroxychromene-2-carboxylate isomerase n=1 Tax=Sinimarinibacterium sp. CAU 1509 TaxID=2562283 RepID=UPI0010ABE546|nr:2-hydroxychromene-2-carboxylate isomerase [Sinimarinibacterium sp. CAU 1509]TJY56659.1 2-hydroxychromene-2-carboxylate isomerase [Sinimarinibacterium sp. CAU 1509]
MPRVVQFWFEFASTYSYPAAMTLEAAAAAAGVSVQWRAFLLGPVFREQGYDSSPFIQFPAKGRYMWRDIQRLCARMDLPYRQPSSFPRTSVSAARIVAAYGDAPWIGDFVRAVYTANFANDQDIADDGVIQTCLVSIGQDADTLLASVAQSPLKERLRQNTDQARTLGIFGAPSYWVDGELFWGNERQADALAWACGERI